MNENTNSARIRFKLNLFKNRGITLKIRKQDGGHGFLTGILGDTQDGLVIVQSRGTPYPVEIERIIDVWIAKGTVEP